MPDHVYRIIQVAGSSDKSIEDAIQNAVGRASRTLRQVGWFEVVETRGHVEDSKVAHYQVTLKAGVYARRRLTSGHFREGVQRASRSSFRLPISEVDSADVSRCSRLVRDHCAFVRVH